MLDYPEAPVFHRQRLREVAVLVEDPGQLVYPLGKRLPLEPGAGPVGPSSAPSFEQPFHQHRGFRLELFEKLGSEDAVATGEQSVALVREAVEVMRAARPTPDLPVLDQAVRGKAGQMLADGTHRYAEVACQLVGTRLSALLQSPEQSLAGRSESLEHHGSA